MDVKFKDNEIRVAARLIGSLTRAGLAQDLICARMSEMQPKKKAFWLEAADQAAGGVPLSQLMEDSWPPAYIQAIKAGENSGSLAAVLKEINHTIVRKQEVMKILIDALKPFGFVLGGIGVLFFFLVSVIPSLPAPRGIEPSMIRVMSNTVMETLASDAKYMVGGVIAAVLFGLYVLFKSPSFQRSFMEMIDKVPGLGRGVRALAWSIFARYLIVLSNAGGGLDVAMRLRMAAESMPKIYQEEVDLLIYDLAERNMGIASAVNPDQQEEGDPRRKWPMLFTSALMNYEVSGNMGEELQAVVDDLEEDGRESIAGPISLMKLVGMLAAVSSIMFPMASYLMETVESTRAMG
ncbi:MAG: type II secretion system F family protein [Marinospirillum sp.]|uniref:type II secretion system F family protein n=1 Tax=Marinospirillum sp. TaxID=2183934 RepID=UPI0019EB5C04|nr:type II secretion system F family protein [Marinospirillum sp.]MBE0506258.1 type II secretion system F family protein [Marinospirillum sp.]